MIVCKTTKYIIIVISLLCIISCTNEGKVCAIYIYYDCIFFAIKKLQRKEEQKSNFCIYLFVVKCGSERLIILFTFTDI